MDVEGGVLFQLAMDSAKMSSNFIQIKDKNERGLNLQGRQPIRAGQ